MLKLIDNCDFLGKYVLAGGSALTLHLCHRKSEDLDFFTYAEDFDKKEIFDYLGRFESARILNQTNLTLVAFWGTRGKRGDVRENGHGY